jgi:hypothetical protein
MLASLVSTAQNTLCGQVAHIVVTFLERWYINLYTCGDVRDRETFKVVKCCNYNYHNDNEVD